MHGSVDPGAKIAALQPFPTGLTSIRYPLYSMAVIVSRDIHSARATPQTPPQTHGDLQWRPRRSGARRWQWLTKARPVFRTARQPRLSYFLRLKM